VNQWIGIVLAALLTGAGAWFAAKNSADETMSVTLAGFSARLGHAEQSIGTLHVLLEGERSRSGERDAALSEQVAVMQEQVKHLAEAMSRLTNTLLREGRQ
jgi:hypothetical protein